MTRSYTVIYQAIPPEEGKGFYAHIPALGITTDGRTLSEAKHMARDAIAAYVEASKEIGREIPSEIPPQRIKVAV